MCFACFYSLTHRVTDENQYRKKINQHVKLAYHFTFIYSSYLFIDCFFFFLSNLHYCSRGVQLTPGTAIKSLLGRCIQVLTECSDTQDLLLDSISLTKYPFRKSNPTHKQEKGTRAGPVGRDECLALEGVPSWQLALERESHCTASLLTPRSKCA